MGYIEVRDYVNKKFSDITKNTNEIKAYNLGWASGLFEMYKWMDRECGAKDTDEIFNSLLTGKEGCSVIFRTLVDLYRK